MIVENKRKIDDLSVLPLPKKTKVEVVSKNKSNQILQAVSMNYFLIMHFEK